MDEQPCAINCTEHDKLLNKLPDWHRRQLVEAKKYLGDRLVIAPNSKYRPRHQTVLDDEEIKRILDGAAVR